MRVLVLNSGSSSIKFQLIRMPEEKTEIAGIVDAIGAKDASIKYMWGARFARDMLVIPDHKTGLSELLVMLRREKFDLSDLGAVGHRVVHGGDRFAETVLITPEVEEVIERNAAIAPLHNPVNLLGIRVARELLPDIPHVAVFDTAFHQTMPEIAYRYAIPENLYRDHGIRRYGFHGTSHRYVAERAAALLYTRVDKINVITCHLGNGASIAAIREGKSVDTTMGFTPMEGMVMGTRAGDIDPGIILYLQRTLGMTVDQVDRLLNKESGLLALSGYSSDMRQVAACDTELCLLAVDVMAYRVRKTIGAYMAVLGKVHAIVFTGGIGENDADFRYLTCEGLENLGVRMDMDRNRFDVRYERIVTVDNSLIPVLVIPTNEELVIARDAVALLSK